MGLRSEEKTGAAWRPRDVHTSSLNGLIDNMQVEGDALLGHQASQIHFPPAMETLRVAERCKFSSFCPNSVWSLMTHLATIQN